MPLLCLGAIALGYGARALVTPGLHNTSVLETERGNVDTTQVSGIPHATADLQPTGNSHLDTLVEILAMPEGSERKKSLGNFWPTLTPAEYPIMITAAAALPGDPVAIITTLLKKWAEFSPANAIVYSQQIPLSQCPENLWMELLGAWAQRDVRGATAWASAQPAGKRQRDSVVVVARIIAKDRAAEAVDLLHAVLLRNPDTQILEDIFKHWAATNFEAATNRALNEPGFRFQRFMLQGVLKTMEQRSPMEVLKWADQIGYNALREEIVTAQLSRWLQLDATAALNFMASMPPSRERMNALTTGITELVKKDVNAAWAIYNQLPSAMERRQLLRPVIRQALKQNLSEGLNKLRGLPEPDRTQAVIYSVGSIAKDSVPRALELLELLSSGHERGVAVSQICNAWAQFDPLSAANYCLENDRGYGSTVHPLQRVISTWASKDSKAAMAWVNQLPEGKNKEALLVRTLGHSGREQALDMASKMAPQVYAQTASNLVGSWATHDTKAATDWTLKCEVPQARDAAIRSIASQLAYRNKSDAGKWIEGLNPKNRDIAASAAAEQLNYTSNADAMTFAAKISDPILKLLTAESVARTWRERNPEAAEDWIKRTTLFDQKAKQRLLEN